MKIGTRNMNELKVGLVWAGNPDHVIDACRSARLEHFAPLAGAGATFSACKRAMPLHKPPLLQEAWN